MSEQAIRESWRINSSRRAWNPKNWSMSYESVLDLIMNEIKNGNIDISDGDTTAQAIGFFDRHPDIVRPIRKNITLHQTLRAMTFVRSKLELAFTVKRWAK